MAKRWRIHRHDEGHIADLARAAGIPAVVARLLICRGISDPEVAQRFLTPKLSDLRPPEQLPGCAQAAEVVYQAIAAGRRIIIYGDYDVDGVTGTALLWKCIKLLGGDVGYYIPRRADEGYGLNHKAVRSLAKHGASLLITVDCGIADIDEAQTAKECGLELIITDHHQPGETLPQAAAIVHPSLPGGGYPFAGLCGAGVALKLAWSICQLESGTKKVSPRMRKYLIHAVGLAAMGTVADVVPLVDENRALVMHGLATIKEHPGPGLEALMKIAQVFDKPAVSSEDVAFSLGPRINAAGRLGQAIMAVELLITDKADRAEELAQYIDQLNSDRQSLERRIMLAANKQVKEHFDPKNDAALVLADREWNPGVIGIVAGRLAEKYHRPVILIAWDRLAAKPGMGSARSVPGFNLHAALAACEEHLVGYGGHAAAAGLKIEEDKLDAFRHDFCQHAAEEIAAGNRTAELRIDAEASLAEFTFQTVTQMERLAPFGQSNARPMLCATGVRLAGPPRAIGSGGHHLSIKLTQHDVTLRAVAFGGGDWAEELSALDGPIDVAFRPVINTFRGQRNVELHLVDWQATGSGSS